METLAEPAVIDQMTPIPFRVRSVREELSAHLHPGAGTARRQVRVPARAVHDGLRLRDRRGADLDQQQLVESHDDPADDQKRTGAVTHALGRLKSGDYVGIRGPFGTPWPMDETKGGDLLIIGGGIGVAPLRPAIYHAIENRNDYERVVVLYGTRTPDDILFERRVARVGERTDITTMITVDAADRGWNGSVGVVTRLIGRVGFDPANTTALVCGPEIMMTVTAERLIDAPSVAPENIYVTMERNMKCGIGVCGHCQFGSKFICTDGAVFRYPDVAGLFDIKGV